MEENNKLIPIANNSLVQKATISLAITNKLIAENTKQLVIEIFRKNPKLFLDLISEYYPLNFELLKKLDSKFTIIEIKSCDEDDFDFTGRFQSLKAEFEAQLQEEARLNALVQEQLAKVVV